MTKVKNEQKKESRKKRRQNLDLGMISALLLLLFRLPLANILGNDGNGYLAFAWEISIAASLFFGHCFYSVMKDMIKRRVQKSQYHNSLRVLSTGMILGGFLSLLGGSILFLCSDIIFQRIYPIKEAALSLKVFSFFLIISTFSGCIRGYFEGIGSRMPTYFSKIIEAFVGGIGAILFSLFLTGYGAKVAKLLFNDQFKPGFGAAGAAAGFLSGSILAFLFLLIIYRIYQIPFKELLKKDETKVFEKRSTIIKEIFLTSIVVLLPVLFLKGYRLVNFTLFLNEYENDTLLQGVKYIGSYYGKVTPLIFICITLLLTVLQNNVGRIKKACTARKLKSARRFYAEDLKMFVIFTLPVSVLMIVFGKFLLQFIFQTAQKHEVIMLQVAAVNIVIITIANYGYFILSSMNKNIQIAMIYGISFVVQTLSILIFKKTTFAAYSLVIAEIIFWLTVLTCNSVYLYRLLEYRLRKNNSVYSEISE